MNPHYYLIPRRFFLLVSSVIIASSVTATAAGGATAFSGFEGDTSFRVAGEAGDGVTGGESFYFGPLDADFFIRAYGTNAIYVQVAPRSDLPVANPGFLSTMPCRRATCLSGTAETWHFTLAAPVGQTPALGVYSDAVWNATSTSPGLQVFRNCLGCGSSAGSFEIKQIEYGVDPAVTALWATFEFRCYGGTKIVRGEIRYRATAFPAVVVAPGSAQAIADEPIELGVVAMARDGSLPNLESEGLPAGATLTDHGDGSGMLRWVPGFDQRDIYGVRLLARTVTGDTASGYLALKSTPIHETFAPMDANALELTISNRGLMGYDFICHKREAYYPRGTSQGIASAVGLWVGATVDGIPRVAIGDYAPEFSRGISLDGSPSVDPRHKNYKIVRGNTSSTDYRNWPADHGAPIDSLGRPLVIGDATIWSVYNDAVSDAHRSDAGKTLPLGVEVRQTTWAEASGSGRNAIFLKYAIHNRGGNRLEDAHVGLWVDPAVWFAIGHVGVLLNNLVGCDSLLGLGFAYSPEESFREDGSPPAAIGALLLRGPSRRVGGTVETLGATSFRRIVAGPYGGVESYRALIGLKNDGSDVHEFDIPTSPVTRFEMSGDPVAGSGWLDEAFHYDEHGFLLASGPFTMEPGDSQVVVAAIVAAQGADRLASVATLRDQATQIRARMGYDTNQPPGIACPDSATTHIGSLLTVDVSSSDPNGDDVQLSVLALPTGATFGPVDIGRSRLDWVPALDQVGTFVVTIVAVDGRGGRASKALVLAVTRENHRPVAVTGGPYAGAPGASIEFDATGSNDPDGDPLAFAWSFGDGGLGTGASVPHTYSAVGTYLVTLDVSDGAMSDQDSTRALIEEVYSADASLLPSDPVVRLRSERPLVWIALDPARGSFAPEDVRSGSVTMSRLDTGAMVSAVQGKADVSKDADGDGINEYHAAFSKDDLRVLFVDVAPGRSDIPVLVRGELQSGTQFVARGTLLVEAGKPGLGASVAPNPFNPDANLTFRTTREGSVRVTVYDLSGRLVQTLLDEPRLPTGFHSIPVARRSGDRVLSSGLYFFRVEADGGLATGRFVILK